MEKEGKEKIPGEAVSSGIHPFICAVSKYSLTGHILQVRTTGHGGLKDDWAAILPSKTSSLRRNWGNFRLSIQAICWKQTPGKLVENSETLFLLK